MRPSLLVNNNKEYNFYKFTCNCVHCDCWHCQALKRNPKCLRRYNSRENRTWKSYRKIQYRIKILERF